MKIIIIGCGLIGIRRAQIISGLNFSIYACIDKNFSSAKKLAKEHNALPLSEIDQIDFKKIKIDAAFIATPHNYLCKIAKKLIVNGISLFLEKPGAINSKELVELKALNNFHKKLIAFGYNHRFHSAMLKANKLISTGELGSPMFARGRYGHGGRVGYDKEWRSDKNISGGGELIDQGPHLIDLTHLYLGETCEVSGFASTLFWDMDVDDNAFLTLKTYNKCVSQIQVSCSEWRNLFSLEIYFSKAKLHFEGLGGSYGLETLTLFRMTPEMGPPDIESWSWPGKEMSWERETKLFLNSIKDDHLDPYLVNIDAAIKILIVVEKIYKNGLYKQDKRVTN